MFSHILAHEPIKAYLEKAIQNNRLAQTLLFAGPDGIGKRLFAKALAKVLLKSSHALDLHLYAPEGKSGLYPIDTLREMIDKEHAAPFEGDRKVFLLDDVDRMQPASANALLKTLEEPTPETTFILLTSNLKEILATILSRCTILHFQALPEETVAMFLRDQGHPIHLAKLAHGSIGRALELASHPEFEEQRKMVFRLLKERPSYPVLSSQLTKLDDKGEDPLKAIKQAEHLFCSILMWYRDQHARSLGVSPEHLFFPDESGQENISLEEVEAAVERARFAFQRNIKLSVCLVKLCTLHLHSFS